MVKKIVFYCCLYLLIQSPIFAQNEMPGKHSILIKKGLKEWINSFENFSLDDFSVADSFPFDYKVLGNPPTKMDKTSRAVFKTHLPILSPNKNKSKYIDLYSEQMALEKRNGKYYSYMDDGGAVRLWDLEKNMYYRIAYSALSSFYEEILWLNADDFILARINRDVIKDDIIGVPVLCFGNTKKEILFIYTNKNTGCIQKKEGYISPHLKKIKIEY